METKRASPRKRFELLLPDELRELFDRAAANDGRPLASWIRARLKEIAERETDKDGKR